MTSKANMVYMGIDPGLTGAIGILDGQEVRVMDMPILIAGTKNRKVLDVFKLSNVLANLVRNFAKKGKNIYAGYEEQIAMPRQSSQSTAKIFRQLGAIEGLLYAFKIPHLPPIRSVTWKKEVFSGMPKGGKDISILYVQKKYPNIELIPKGCRSPRDGRSDAICIAEYTRKIIAYHPILGKREV